MVHPTRRQLIKGAAATVGAMSIAPGLMAQAAPVRVGYTMARTGPWTGGAQVSQEPNYLLWAEQQNAAGGLSVKGVKRPIELISSATTAATSRPACAPTRSSWAGQGGPGAAALGQQCQLRGGAAGEPFRLPPSWHPPR
jgi:hypothetical protein